MHIVLKTDDVWLICGGRDFADADLFHSVMSDMMRVRGGCPKKVVHGAASGADTMAEKWAERMAIGRHRFPAQWEKHGKAAGPIRNQAMIDKGRPNLVIAFPGGRGTADMVSRARDAGIDVAEIKVTA
jgi:hypothetical protein